ncbi:MAG: phospho-sugar mutase [Sphingobacteriia bacterium]|jgi:phosphoglucomutase|nr:phospho-sugar mutase [Paludibacteraceae bacterium]NCA79789.1 phospho-sugar mutase [Sphingobacteriia bacterium]
MEQDVLKQVMTTAQTWLDGNYDAETKAQVRAMMEADDKTELIESFYRTLEFGTGGLRGIMGPGCNRMNKYIVGQATQGFANYLLKSQKNNAFAKPVKQVSVVVGHDCRNNSRLFAETVANIFSANGIKVFLFEGLRPTPEISFAIRHLGCQAGVNITASHNPREYNGYKAYWEDGAQVLTPHDNGIIEEVNKTTVDDIKSEANKDLIQIVGGEIDYDYMEAVRSLRIDEEVIKHQKDLNIVYTPLHGAGRVIIPLCLRSWGFQNIHVVPEQMVIDGNFPTVVSPNPENAEAMTMGMNLGSKLNADLVIASDPDADRLAIVCRNSKGEWTIINGNQTCMMFSYYIITNMKKLGKLKPEDYLVKTIVTTELIRKIADRQGVTLTDEYTGFKWIANRIREWEGTHKYIGGGEESFGFLPYDAVRDKDSPASICLICEIAAWAKDHGMSLYEYLLNIYMEYGFQRETTINIVRPGKTGADEIKQMMSNYREHPITEIAGSKVVKTKDFQLLKQTENGVVSDIVMPAKSNVLQYFTADGLKVSVRPSGTEPKIKFYFEIPAEMKSIKDYDKATAEAEARVPAIRKSLGL